MIARMTEPSAPQPPAPPVPPKRRRGRLIAGALVLFVGGCSIGTAAGSAGKSTPTAAPAVTVTPAAVTVTPAPAPAVTVTKAGAAAVPVPAVTVTVTSAPVPGPTVTVVQTAAGGGGGGGAAGTGFPGDGTFIVGSDVQAGTYRSGTPTSGNCYWSRLSTTDGAGTDGILANNNSAGPSVVTIQKTDKAFNTSGCEAWTKVG